MRVVYCKGDAILVPNPTGDEGEKGPDYSLAHLVCDLIERPDLSHQTIFSSFPKRFRAM